jgi:cobyrinic acid a,c-diamide synthase
MTGRQYVERLFARATEGADIAVIEGVMGLFDGASPTTLEGSSAEIAIWLDVPVVLVASAHGAARSLAAVVKGFAEFEPAVRLAGVVANQAGSERHRDWLREALSASGLPRLVGAVGRGALPVLPSRHLGLVTASADGEMAATIDQLADMCEKCLELDELMADCGLSIADCERVGGARGHGRDARATHGQDGHATTAVRIGIARDDAFHFYYADNLSMLRELGAELVEFSPLTDRRLPRGLGGVYLGGGYPELHCEALGANAGMLEDLRRHAADGKAIYAECGGLMYLGQGIKDLGGKRWAMAGVIPIETAMLGKLRSLGYVEAAAQEGSMFGGARRGGAMVLRGHEFHYSEIVSDHSAADGWRGAYAISRRNGSVGGGGARGHGRDARATHGQDGHATHGQDARATHGRDAHATSDRTTEGYCKGAILASYVHVHFGSCPQAAERFVELCREKR